MGDRGPLGNLEPETCHACSRTGETGTMFVPEGSFVIDTAPPIYEWLCKERETCEAAAYARAVNAPLSPAAIEALAEALKRGDVPRQKVRRRTDG